ncbi:MAG: hypothetical protein RL375_1235 [Pseudomonadota bacterium]
MGTASVAAWSGGAVPGARRRVETDGGWRTDRHIEGHTERYAEVRAHRRSIGRVRWLNLRLAMRLAVRLVLRLGACLVVAGPAAVQAQGSAGAAPASTSGGAPPPSACRADPARPERLVANSPGLALALVPQRWPVPVGQHFSVDITVCGERPDAGPPRLLGLDADMPLHRHGMNYRASIEPLGSGRYRARGLMFHMPGRWRFVADLAEPGGATRRLTVVLDLP